MEKIKATLIKVGFIISTVAAFVLLLILDRRRRTIVDLKQEAERHALASRLNGIMEKASKSEADYSRAYGDYLRLKRSLPHLFERNNPPGGGA